MNSDNAKYTRIAQEFGFFPLKDELKGIDTPGTLLDGAIYSEKDFTDLLDRLRLYCLDATQSNVKYLVDLYKLGIKDIGLVAAAAEYCLSEGLKVATNLRYWIDMTDMVYVPWIMVKRSDSRFNAAITSIREQLRFILLDEAQDTDLLQIEMLSVLVNPARSFLTAVGDRNQAVYFFRGALNDGMDRITKRFQGENLPLPVCYRCGTLHLELVREVFPRIPIQPRPGAPSGEIRVVHNRDFHRIFDSEHLSYMGVCRKNAPLVKAAIQLLAAGKPAKIKDRNIGGRLVARVKDICQKQRVRYDPETFIRVSVEYEQAQRRRLQDFPNSENQILDLTDMLEAIRALFQAYDPDTLKAWSRIVERIFDESGYSPISLYTIHSGKGGEGQVSFIIYPEDLPFSHPKQVPEEKAQEDHLLYVALTRTLADGAEGSGILYLVCREANESDSDDNDEAHKHHPGKVKWPEWLPKKYRQLWTWGKSDKPNLPEKCPDTSLVQDTLEESEEEGFDLMQMLDRTLTDRDYIPPTPTISKKRLDTASTETAVSEAETSKKWIDTALRQDSNTEKPTIQTSVVIRVPKVRGYERVVTAREITFTCEHCGQTVTQERMPGPLPSYCSDRCRLDAAAARKKAVRARTGKNKGQRGRPRKAEADT